MGFGAIITAGDGLEPLDDAAMQRLVEARVEHELSKPARFALRFEDDICEGASAVAGHPQLQAGTKLGIFVESSGERACLVYGPITQVRSAATTGGTGNWHEVHGEDRRVEMDRVEIQAAYEGHASDIARQILTGYGFTPEVEDTERVYNSDDNKLTQRGSDLKFLETIAQKNNFEFWISYEVGPVNPLTGMFELTEAANLRPSPARGSPSPVPVPPVLVPSVDQQIRVSPPPTECTNVTRFEVKVDYERPHAAKGFAMDLSAGRAVALRRLARDVVSGRCDPADPECDRRLLATPEIGPWTVQCLALYGRGEMDSLPAGDLGYIKLVGHLTGLGRRATIPEVEEFYAPYEPFRGLVGTLTLSGLHRTIATGPPLRFAA